MLFVYLMLSTVLYNFTRESIADPLVHRYTHKGLRNFAQPLCPLHMVLGEAPCATADKQQHFGYLEVGGPRH